MKPLVRISGLVVVAALLCAALPGQGAAPAAPAKDPLVGILRAELGRASQELSKADPKPYFLSYAVADQDDIVMVGSEGTLYNSTRLRRRTVDVAVRVGAPSLDNTHGGSRSSGLSTSALPLNDDPDAVRRVLWQVTDREYKQASRAYLKAKTNTAVRAQEEDNSPDFSKEPPHTAAEPALPPLKFDGAAWEDRIRRYSSSFRSHPEVDRAVVLLLVEDTRKYFVSSEGSEVVVPERVVRLVIEAETRAPDGMELARVESFQASEPEALPGEAEIAARAEKMAADLKQLRAAPVAEPFDGPALLSGRSAAVFFHEVLGHRVEGQRQKGDEEGQTFAKKINQPVLPAFLSVVDDPTQRRLNGAELSGWYEYDDEGIPASRVEVVQAGVLKNFLMSRLPVKNFSESNGHGRAQEGRMPVGRQGNLIVTSTHQVPDAELRQKLIEEIKRQGKPYGLYFEDIQGGFTLTSRQSPQAFLVLPVMVWRVYPDGRPDELVRGVDIVGTPLGALNRILVTGTETQVFNGVCGAESGQVPVSAAAPAMLFSEIEVQKQSQSHDRPPLLPPPPMGPPAAPQAGGKR